MSEFSLYNHMNKTSTEGIILLKKLNQMIKLRDQNVFKCPDACFNILNMFVFKNCFHTSHNNKLVKMNSHYTSCVEFPSSGSDHCSCFFMVSSRIAVLCGLVEKKCKVLDCLKRIFYIFYI